MFWDFEFKRKTRNGCKNCPIFEVMLVAHRLVAHSAVKVHIHCSGQWLCRQSWMGVRTLDTLYHTLHLWVLQWTRKISLIRNQIEVHVMVYHVNHRDGWGTFDLMEKKKKVQQTLFSKGSNKCLPECKSSILQIPQLFMAVSQQVHFDLRLWNNFNTFTGHLCPRKISPSIISAAKVNLNFSSTSPND